MKKSSCGLWTHSFSSFLTTHMYGNICEEKCDELVRNHKRMLTYDTTLRRKQQKNSHTYTDACTHGLTFKTHRTATVDSTRTERSKYNIIICFNKKIIVLLLNFFLCMDLCWLGYQVSVFHVNFSENVNKKIDYEKTAHLRRTRDFLHANKRALEFQSQFLITIFFKIYFVWLE